MFRFEHIEYLWLLTALVPLVLLFVWFKVWRRKGLKAFGKTSLVQQLTPQVSSGKQVLKFVLLALAYTFMVLGFANPWYRLGFDEALTATLGDGRADGRADGHD